jgi:hypothetical protein
LCIHTHTERRREKNNFQQTERLQGGVGGEAGDDVGGEARGGALRAHVNRNAMCVYARTAPPTPPNIHVKVQRLGGVKVDLRGILS